MTRLWKVDQTGLTEVSVSSPSSEAQLEEWIANDPGLLGLDLMIIARQRQTDFGGRIDLLGIDREGDLTLIEMKRDRTPRDVIAQTLDYASWVKGLTTPQIYGIAKDYLPEGLAEAFRKKFSTYPPEPLNTSHNLLIVASGFDPSSKRIVEYLAETHGVSINTAFFTYFRDGGQEFLAADFLLDQEQVVERSEAKTKAPWTGFYYVNAGHDPDVRVWDDMQKFGFVAAGYGRFYSGRLDQLSPGDPIFVYQKGRGYIGHGIVSSTATMAKDFETMDGRKLSEVDLKQPAIIHDQDDPELAEYLVGVDWKKTFPISDARSFSGAFANQNVVCKLRDPATLEFLMNEFDAEPAEKGA